MRLTRKWLAGLVLFPLVSPGAWAKERAGYDTFRMSQEHQGLVASEESLRSRGVRVESTEERLGVPGFLWKDAPGGPGNKALAGMKAQDAAREHLRAYADLYRLSSRDAMGAELRHLHATKRGPVVARFGQSVDGIEVFRDELKVVMNRDNELVAISGYLAPSQAVEKARLTASRAFRLSAEDAIASAFRDMTGVALSPRSLVSTGKPNGAYTAFVLEEGSRRLLTWSMEEPARARKVFFTLPDRLEPAWYVEVNAGPMGSAGSESSAFVVSATDGTLLLRNDLRSHASHGYRVWADPVTLLPHDGPQGSAASPHPTGLPDRYQAPFIAPELVTLRNYPFSKNDPWLPANATQTTGNNVEAYADRAAPDGFQPGADLRASVTAPGLFDSTFDTTLAPNANDTQLEAATVNLFYVTNFLHDWFYDAGFDEAAGNAQALNFGRGGLEGDSLKAEAQDSSGRNFSDMVTPADGARPRMQLYIYNGVPMLQVNAPASLAGNIENGRAVFGAQVFDVAGDVKILNPAGTTPGCTAFPAGTFTGKIALLDRGGGCVFSIKAYNAQNAGAVAVIIANNVANQPAPILATGTNAELVTLPVLSAPKEAADAWKAEVKNNGTTVNVLLKRGPSLDRDGSLDNDLIAHEWGHYISNRLIANANGLTNNQGRSLGEGWGDFHALLLKVREEDRNHPGNNLYQGVYAVAAYVQAGGANNGYYYGIRRVPYSTDFTKNGLTLKHIANGTPLPTTHPVAYGQTGVANSAVHDSGEVWATMLWECYASLLNAYPFQEAQDRMKQYLVAAYKVTPRTPTFLEARDALLAVAAATDPADHQRFLTAFARRGAGVGAKVGERHAQDHIGVVESFESGANLGVLGVRLDDSVTGCDKDGVLDLGETGRLSVTVRNTGVTALEPFAATVTSDSTTATLAFPDGTQLSFPRLAPNQTATASLKVGLTAVMAGPVHRAGLKLAFQEPSLPASAKSLTFDPRIHSDERMGGSTTDDAEAAVTAFSSDLLNASERAWQLTGTPDNHYYHVTSTSHSSDLSLTTPWLHVAPTGNFTFSFKHRYSYESVNGGGAPYWDGSVIEITTDGRQWQDLYPLGINTGYSGVLAAGDNVLTNRPAFAGLSAGYPAWLTQTVNLGTLFAGQKVRLRFRQGSDSDVGAYGWDLDDLTFNNLVNAPFSALVSETSDGTVCNQRPVAHAGPSQSQPEGKLDAQGGLERTLVTLDGSGSFDPEGQPLTYQWTQVSGPAVTLSANDVAQPSFTADVAREQLFTFQLVVGDGTETSLPRQVEVTVLNVNRPPKAVAGVQATVDERGGLVTLEGSGSSDPDGEALTYTWAQVSGPPVAVTNATQVSARFEPPEVSVNTPFTFSLTVSDGAATATSTVVVTVNNVDRAPVANAGEDRMVEARASVSLTGTATDADGDAITYAWTQVGGEPVSLTGADTARLEFTAPDVRQGTQLVFQLVATAQGAQSAPDTVTVSVQKANRRPVVLAGPNVLEENERTRLTLTATGNDADGDSLTYSWQQTGGPLVLLEGADTAHLSFTTPEVLGATLLTFRLYVKDTDNAESESVLVSLTVKDVNRAPASKPRKVAGSFEGQTITLDASASSDPDGDALTYTWEQTEGPEVTLSAPTEALTTFIPTKLSNATNFTFSLTVTDSRGMSSTETVKVTVLNVDEPKTESAGCSSTGSGSGWMMLLLLGGLVLSRRRRTGRA